MGQLRRIYDKCLMEALSKYKIPNLENTLLVV